MDLAIFFIITIILIIIINNHAKPLVLGYFRFHERIRFSDFDCRAIMRLQVLRSVSVRSLMLSANLKIQEAESLTGKAIKGAFHLRPNRPKGIESRTERNSINERILYLRFITCLRNLRFELQWIYVKCVNLSWFLLFRCLYLCVCSFSCRLQLNHLQQLQLLSPRPIRV